MFLQVKGYGHAELAGRCLCLKRNSNTAVHYTYEDLHI